MQYKTAFIVTCIASYGFLSMKAEGDHSQAIAHHIVSESHEADVPSHLIESDPVVDEILALIEHKAIQTPTITPPSPVMKWLRSIGISILYKYQAVKTWITSDA